MYTQNKQEWNTSSPPLCIVFVLPLLSLSPRVVFTPRSPHFTLHIHPTPLLSHMSNKKPKKGILKNKGNNLNSDNTETSATKG
jgi:hypothetical protein